MIISEVRNNEVRRLRITILLAGSRILAQQWVHNDASTELNLSHPDPAAGKPILRSMNEAESQARDCR